MRLVDLAAHEPLDEHRLLVELLLHALVQLLELCNLNEEAILVKGLLLKDADWTE